MPSRTSSANLVDISFAGAIITIDGTVIDKFMDDQNPIEFQDTEVCNMEWSCNGRMIRTIKPNSILMSVTVIPNSNSDRALRKIFKANLLNGGRVKLSEANRMLTASITLDRGKGGSMSYNFSNGTCVSGPAGPTALGSGKMGGNTYTFAFEICE